MKTKLLCFLLVALPLFLTAFQENQTELKTVDYWLENNERRMDYWLMACKSDLTVNDDCAVIARLHMSGEKSAYEMYDKILRQRNKNKMKKKLPKLPSISIPLFRSTAYFTYTTIFSIKQTIISALVRW